MASYVQGNLIIIPVPGYLILTSKDGSSPPQVIRTEEKRVGQFRALFTFPSEHEDFSWFNLSDLDPRGLAIFDPSFYEDIRRGSCNDIAQALSIAIKVRLDTIADLDTPVQDSEVQEVYHAISAAFPGRDQGDLAELIVRNYYERRGEDISAYLFIQDEFCD